MSDASDPQAHPPRGLGPLRRALDATRRRIRLQRALDAGTLFGIAGLGLAALVLGLLKTGALPESEGPALLCIACALPLVAALIGAARRVPALLPAKLLDRAHGLKDRIGNAVSFADDPSPTEFMDAAIRDAQSHASELKPADAMPISLPRELMVVGLLALGIAGLSVLEVPHIWEERITHGGIVAVQLHSDDLDAYDQALDELLEDPETSDEVRAAASEFNRIIEDLADERLDREESLRRLAELERRLAETRPADNELLRDALRELGEDLRRSELAQELSSALRDEDAERAEAEMRRLAEQLRNDQPNRRDAESLRRALQRAAERRAENRSEEIERREQELQRLLQRQREQNEAETPRQRRLLERRRRELDRLRQQNREAQARQRQLERLRRELQRSAEALQQQQPQRAADDLDRGAEDLNRMARQQMSEEEMRQLQQMMEQLREAIRRQRQQQQAQGGQQGQQGQQGQGQGRMDRFVLRARGQGQGGGVSLGVPGQGGQQGQNRGQGNGQGQGQNGQQGEQGQQQQMLTLGGNGEPNAVLELPGMGQGQQAGGQGGGAPQPGPGAGTGHDPTTLDDPSRIQSRTRSVRIEGEQQGGPSRSEVIRESGQRGFASRGYRDTYTDYQGHAEQVLERDEVPPGRRFYVRRYFQLIRPRD